MLQNKDKEERKY